MEEFLATPKESSIESAEKHEFTIQEISALLKSIDGVERPGLSIVERKENSKGELMFICFTNGEKEELDGVETEITYLITVAGQRYKEDGTPGRVVPHTFLTKDYDEGMTYSEQLDIYIDGEWKSVKDKRLSEEKAGIIENQNNRASIVQDLGFEIVINDGKFLTVTKNGYRIRMLHFAEPSESGIEEGRISSIEIAKDDNRAVVWDRGPTDSEPWDDKSKQILKELISALN